MIFLHIWLMLIVSGRVLSFDPGRGRLRSSGGRGQRPRQSASSQAPEDRRRCQSALLPEGQRVRVQTGSRISLNSSHRSWDCFLFCQTNEKASWRWMSIFSYISWIYACGKGSFLSYFVLLFTKTAWKNLASQKKVKDEFIALNNVITDWKRVSIFFLHNGVLMCCHYVRINLWYVAFEPTKKDSFVSCLKSHEDNEIRMEVGCGIWCCRLVNSFVGLFGVWTLSRTGSLARNGQC